jgi:GNAT superfamily N-acetyltransferase
MRIRWLNDLTPLHVWANLEAWSGDEYERDFLKHRHPDLALGAFIDKECVGIITGALHVKSAWISHFIVNPNYRNQGIGKALFEYLLQILENLRPQIYLHAALNMAPFYSKYGFKTRKEVCRYAYENPHKSFYFEPHENLEKTRPTIAILELDNEIFNEDRKPYLEHSFNHPSSLLLANSKGYLHSRMMDKKYLFIGPFVAKTNECAQYLLKGLLFFRGAKPMIIDTPKQSCSLELLENVGFTHKNTTVEMAKNSNTNPKYEYIYAYGSTGVWG